MTDFPRLIEFAFPLKQASLDSVHEKMCHAGHPKAIHIWPARRPLAACRAALIATLLPDPPRWLRAAGWAGHTSTVSPSYARRMPPGTSSICGY